MNFRLSRVFVPAFTVDETPVTNMHSSPS